MVTRHSELKRNQVSPMNKTAPKGTVVVQAMMLTLAVGISQNLVFRHLLPSLGVATPLSEIAIEIFPQHERQDLQRSISMHQ